jgi:hypothetical protein
MPVHENSCELVELAAVFVPLQDSGRYSIGPIVLSRIQMTTNESE